MTILIKFHLLEVSARWTEEKIVLSFSWQSIRKLHKKNILEIEKIRFFVSKFLEAIFKFDHENSKLGFKSLSIYTYSEYNEQLTNSSREFWPRRSSSSLYERDRRGPASDRFRGNLLPGSANLFLANLFREETFIGGRDVLLHHFTGSIGSEISQDRFVTSG